LVVLAEGGVEDGVGGEVVGVVVLDLTVDMVSGLITQEDLDTSDENINDCCQ
jgi:hypothetical protein